MMQYLLPNLLVCPLVGFILVFLGNNRLSKWIALATSLVGVALAAVLYCEFDAAKAFAFQFPFSISWIPAYAIRFGLAVDGLSMPLVVLSKIMMPIAILASWHEERKTKSFMACLLLLDLAMVGTFLTTDIFVFYVFWEMMLIPMILIIGVWGSQDRIYASMKFFLYTFAGSVLMLVAIFWLYSKHQVQFGFPSGDIRSLYHVTLSKEIIFMGMNAEELIFWGFTLAFLIKVPLFPLHTWLPDAHVQAPTGGSILLAAVLLKMGTYGLLRLSVPICPEAFIRFVPILVVLSLAGILYGAWVAFQQTDMKKLVAYSSVSHLGFVVLGICTLNQEGLTGSFLQMINHGFSTGALFFLVGALYERRHSRNFADYGGIAEVVPWFAIFLVFVSCSSMAVPGLNGFVGEFLILFGAFKANAWWGIIAVSGVVFGALYMLWLLKKVLFGGNISTENKMLKDLYLREWAGLVPMAFFIVLLGVAPSVVTKKVDAYLSQYWKTQGRFEAVETRAALSPVEKTAKAD